MKKVLCLIVVTVFLSACGLPSGTVHVLSGDDEYITDHGMYVLVENVNRPSKSTVENWTNEAFMFWWKLYPKLGRCMINRIYIVNAHFWDQNYIPYEGTAVGNGKVAGLSYGNNIDISYSYTLEDPYLKVRGVFIHELSHQLLTCYKNRLPPEDDHSLMKRTGMDEFTEW